MAAICTAPPPDVGIQSLPLEFGKAGTVIPGADVSPFGFPNGGKEAAYFRLRLAVPPPERVVQTVPIARHGMDWPRVRRLPDSKVNQRSALP